MHVFIVQDFYQPFVIETDASSAGLRDVLSQGRKKKNYNLYQLEFFCKKRRIKSVYEKELWAIVFSITKWKYYVTRRRFIIKIYQKSLKHLLDLKSVSSDQQRWASILLG